MPTRNEVYNWSSQERELMEENPQDAQASVDLAFVAGGVSVLLFPLNFQNNNGDAFRHCFWSCIIAKEVSSKWAQTWVMAHEADASPTNKRRMMDEYNNNQGINIFKNNPNASAGKLIYLCLQSIGNGELKEIKNEKLVPTTLDGHNVPNIFRVISEKVSEVVEFIANIHSNYAQEIDGDGNTALHRCIMDDYEKGFNILVEILDVNRAGMDGQSSLMICSSLPYGHKYAKALLDRGASVDYQDPYQGETALMLAAVYGNREMVNLLIPVANKRIESFSGFTAYDMAVTEENMDIAKLLI